MAGVEPGPRELALLAGVLPLSLQPRRTDDGIVVGYCHSVRRGERFTVLTPETARWLLALDAAKVARHLQVAGWDGTDWGIVADALLAGPVGAGAARAALEAAQARRSRRSRHAAPETVQ